MKKIIKCLLDKFIKNSEIYKDAVEEAESYDIECGKKQRRIEKLQSDLKFKEKEKQEDKVCQQQPQYYAPLACTYC